MLRALPAIRHLVLVIRWMVTSDAGHLIQFIVSFSILFLAIVINFFMVPDLYIALYHSCIREEA